MEFLASGFNTLKAKSSSSSRIHCIPIRPARGANMSMVSRALLICFSGRICLIVRILCSLSPSLTSKTLKSCDIASNNFRKFSACFACTEDNSKFVNFVTPSIN